MRKCSRKIRYVDRSLLTVKLNHSVYANKYIYIYICIYAMCIGKIIAIQRMQRVKEKGKKKREKAVSKPERNKIPILRDS